MVRVGVPTLGQIDVVCAFSLLNLRDVSVDFEVGNRYIYDAKNVLVKRFLESPYSTLVFLDDDLGFSAHDFNRLVGCPGDVVGGIYPSRGYPKYYPQSRLLGALKPDEHGRIPVKWLQGGFLKLSRKVLEHAAKECTKYTRDGVSVIPEVFRSHNLQWDVDKGRGNWFGEDWDFCRWADSEGYKIWALPDVHFRHAGRTVVGGNFSVDVKPS